MYQETTMNSLNSILIEGNLVKDPASRTLPSGTQVCNFVLASNRSYKQNDVYEKEVSFFDVEAWARLGVSCAQNLTKGRGVRVVGRLHQDRWLDHEGKNRSMVKIVAEHVEFKPQKMQVPALSGFGTEQGASAAADSPGEESDTVF
jgi:single-strand DNA-binding protein